MQSIQMILDEEAMKRFWSHVDIRGEDECWIWTGCFTKRPYGHFSVKFSDGRRRNRNAQRVAWVITNGPIQSSRIVVCHRCDNPPCVNPAHLFLGTSQDNADDMKAKNRQLVQKGELNHSAKLTDAQVAHIRERLRRPYRGINEDIAREHGVNASLISMIKTRRIWTHL